MPSEERFDRASHLQAIIRNSDVNQWFYDQVEDALKFSFSQDSKEETPSTPATETSESSATD